MLGIYTEETRIETDMCIPMFIAALFIITWTWNNRLVPNRERSMSRLYIVTLLI